MILAAQVAALVLLGLALMAPLESLRWWARLDVTCALPSPPVRPRPEVRRFAVYLSGIGVLAGDENSSGERATLDAVRRLLGDLVITEDVFPYAMANRGLPQRATAWLWRCCDRLRRRAPWLPVPPLINLRNVMQVLVSADPRYGDTYGYGLAAVVWRSLVQAGFDPRHPVPVTLIGYSGGAQIACGAARYLAAAGLRVDMVSIGGVYSDDPGLDHIGSFVHLSGSRDRLQHLGVLAFPGRWPTAPLSSYGRAVREGRIRVVDVGPVTHLGRDWYFSRSSRLPDGRTHSEATAAALADALRTAGG